MTREEAIERMKTMRWEHATNPCPDRTAFDMAISALSTEGEYIKKSELFDKTVRRNSIWNGTTNAEGKGLEEIVNDLPTYSFPDSADMEKARAEIEDIKTEIGYAFNDIEGSEKVAIVIDNVLSIIDKHLGG